MGSNASGRAGQTKIMGKCCSNNHAQNNSDSAGAFSIQVTISESQEAVNEIYKELLSKGYLARMEESESTDGKLFRALVGNFHTAEDAAPFLEKIREQEGFPDCVVYNNGLGEDIP